MKIRAEDFFKFFAVVCADVPVNIAHVNKSAAEIFAELCSFFKLVVCHVFAYRDGNFRGGEASCSLRCYFRCTFKRNGRSARFADLQPVCIGELAQGELAVCANDISVCRLAPGYRIAARENIYRAFCGASGAVRCGAIFAERNILFERYFFNKCARRAERYALSA